MRLIVCIFCIAMCFSSVSQADVFFGDETNLPEPLDVYVFNVELDSAFPRLILGNGVATRDALSNYRQALENFRQEYIEGLSRHINNNCLQTKDYEKWLNEAAKANAVTRTRFLADKEKIRNERLLCDTRNYHTSLYWQLYDRFLKRYQEADQDAEDRLNQCFSQNACRQRKR